MSEEEGFEDYVETTVDPGYSLIVAVALFCVVTNLMIPCYLSMGRRYRKRRGIVLEEMDGVENECRERKRTVQSYAGGSEPEAEQEVTILQSHPPDGDWVSLHSCGSLSTSNFPPRPKYRLDSAEFNVDQSMHSTTSAASTIPSTLSEIVRNALSEFPVSRARQGRACRGVDEWYRHRQHYQDSLATSMRMMDGGSSEQGTAITPPSFLGSECVLVDAHTPGVHSPSDEDASARLPPSVTVSSKKETSLFEAIDIDTNDTVHDKDCGRSSNERHSGDYDGINCGKISRWIITSMAQSWGDFLDIIYWEQENRRLLKLAIPFTLTTVLEGVFQLVLIGLISHYLGTVAVSAFVVVDIVVGLSAEFLKGIADAISVLCPHARGARNAYLAGQYVHLSALLYTISTIPFLFLWGFTMDSVILWFGFDEQTAQLGQDYAVLAVVLEWLDGLHLCYLNFLDCIDLERWSALISILTALFEVLGVLITVLVRETTLIEVGFILVGVNVVSIAINVMVTVKRGWVKKYVKGMFGNIALKNRKATRTHMRTSLPLCIGSLVENGEWEILALFAAQLGPAEVAAWGILGTLWDTIEATSDEVAGAGEIRCAHHLGSGRPKRARTAAYKSIVLGFIFSSLVTSVLFILGEDLARWLTPDSTLQRMIIEVLPLVGIGNITLTAGAVSWALVGSQGRYRLATTVSFMASWGITLPIAAIFTYGLNVNLQGLTASVVVGFSISGTALSCVVMLSDWPRLSREIVELNACEESSSGSDSDSSSSCSSPSSNTHPQ